jgi:hypothetical protein
MIGARIHAIEECEGQYVMPYVDGIAQCTLSRNGQWFTLDDRGQTHCQTTNGVTHTSRACEHCSEYHDGDEALCETCENDTACCEDCGDRENRDDMTANDNGDYFCSGCMTDRFSCQNCNAIDHVDEGHETGDGDTFCRACYRDGQTRCEIDTCNARFNTHDRTYSQTRRLRARNVHELCNTCADTHEYCGTCRDWYAVDDLGEACEACADRARIAQENADAIATGDAIVNAENEGLKVAS